VYLIGITNIEAALIKSFISVGWLEIMACFSLTFFSIKAFQQTSLKTMLAYSTLSHLSLCLLAISLFQYKTIAISIFHMIAHAFSISCLFFVTGNIYIASGLTELKDLAGIAKKLPFSMLVFSLAALSIIGIPYSVGFTTKFSLAQSCIDTGLRGTIAISSIIINTLFSMAYFGKIIFNAYSKGKDINIVPLPYTMLLGLILSLSGLIYMTIFSSKILKIIEILI
jgi:formate hydrogenlyase subunit 3/multisubunit Na+/H+ antiporter MnhD subunit